MINEQPQLWTIEPHGNGYALYSGRGPTSHGMNLVQLSNQDSNWESTKSLIESAPELLEACQAMISAVDYAGTNLIGAEYMAHQKMVQAVQKVILNTKKEPHMTWLQTHACVECGECPCQCNTEQNSITDKAIERIVKDYTAVRIRDKNESNLTELRSMVVKNLDRAKTLAKDAFSDNLTVLGTHENAKVIAYRQVLIWLDELDSNKTDPT